VKSAGRGKRSSRAEEVRSLSLHRQLHGEGEFDPGKGVALEKIIQLKGSDEARADIIQGHGMWTMMIEKIILGGPTKRIKTGASGSRFSQGERKLCKRGDTCGRTKRGIEEGLSTKKEGKNVPVFTS